MTKIEIVFAIYDNWEALFVDGTLFCQDHSVSLSELATAISGLNGAPFDYVEREVDGDWMYDHGQFPDAIDEVVWAE